ncbi:MAG TPA: glycosyltransferase, partial [Microthrixaceae bacterium]|nr:glycosyltransferase [Microthrixaceae bacterium]
MNVTSETSVPTAGRVLVTHPSAELYGSDRVLLDTVEQLVRRGWSVTTTLPGRGPLIERLEQAGSRVVVCDSPVLRKSALRPRGLVSLAGLAFRSVPPGLRLLRSTRPDVVYVSTVTVPLWMVLAKLTRRPLVCHVHEAETGAHRVLRVAMALPLLMCDRIVANSAFSRDVLARALGRLRGRTEVVSNPVPGPPTPLPTRPTLEGGAHVLYMGRLSPRKGPQFAVAAVDELVRAGRDVDLVLLGSVFDGYEWFEAELRDEIARRDLGDRVELLGFRPDIWPVVAAADIVVVPSVADEPFGNTAVEAVLAARPVVVS